ncbi:prenyltransferase/squalene oxidase repeat-containing protein [Thermococcus pacificus]|uniref:Squalene cyclase C-terminal domain-containing protein n=1 Tax=Thermococcus pacificus TaxID=71998 RepID=A0A218P6M8_9EURY|nr:prenyltransferase/squalene oxidase repeat-containing protein [Thermococcus pacificus]ASJ06433.1 hypothetical protein A3L08_03345 [Thermococcus pacificus]
MKKVLAVIIIVLMLVPAVSAEAIDGSVRFLSGTSENTQQVREISLSIMALAAAKDDVNWDITPEIEVLVNELLEDQNADGGWGYYPNEPSNVLDTAYAVIALRTFIDNVSSPLHAEASVSLKKGLRYLVSANNGEAWGYIPKTTSECYPTLIALWALGMNKYTIHREIVKNAIEYLSSVETCEISPHERFALELIAYHYLKVPVNSEQIERAKYILLNETLTTKERAVLTYALTLYEPVDFNTLRALHILINQGQKTIDNLTYWTNVPNCFGTSELVATTAYAIMGISRSYQKPIPPESFNETTMDLCSVLASAQNPDGGWPFSDFQESNPTVTYYALKALSSCYPRDSKIIQNALTFMRKVMKKEEDKIKLRNYISPEYYYAVKALAESGELSSNEKNEIIRNILNSRLQGTNLWGSKILGPQPLDTAYAIDLLLDLGISPSDPVIQSATKWLMDISSTGWGTYMGGRYIKYMLKPNLFVTMVVLKTLTRVVNEKEVREHIDWLESQRWDKGWGYYKYYEDITGRRIPQEPEIFITTEITTLLLEYGIDYREDTLTLILENLNDIKENYLDLAASIAFIAKIRPLVTLENIVSILNTQSFKVFADSDEYNISKIASNLHSVFGQQFIKTKTISKEGNYVIISKIGGIDVQEYNPQITVEILNSSIKIGDIEVPKSDVVLIVPGRTSNGFALLILYTPGTEEIVKEIFSIGFIKYIRGDAMVLVNENGKARVIVVR